MQMCCLGLEIVKAWRAVRRNLNFITRAVKNYQRALISGFLLSFPKIPPNTSTEIVQMRKEERVNEKGRQIVMVKVSINHLNLCLTIATSSFSISTRLGLSVRKLRHVPVFYILQGH